MFVRAHRFRGSSDRMSVDSGSGGRQSGWLWSGEEGVARVTGREKGMGNSFVEWD